MRLIYIWQVVFVVHFVLHTDGMLDANLICDDFYHYACADWMHSRTKPASEPFWNVYTETSQRISRTLRGILENDSFTNIEDEKRLYKSCMRQNVDYIKELRVVVHKLDGAQQATHTNKQYDYLMHIVEVTKLLNVHPILKFHVRQNILHIERGDFVFPELFLSHPERYASELSIYSTWIENSLALLSAESKELSFIAAIMRGTKHIQTSATLAKEIVAFEVALCRLQRGRLTRISAAKLGKFNALLGHAINGDVKEIVIDELYFDALHKLVESTHWRHISNYIVWSAIKDLSRDVSDDFRQLTFEVDRQLIGVAADISRERECIDQIITYIGQENLRANFETFTKQNHKQMTNVVTAMANEIRESFIAWVRNNDGLSKRARMNIMKKIANVKLEILAPGRKESIKTGKFKLGSNHLINMLRLKSLKFANQLQTINDNDTVHIQWPGSIFDVNAFYSPAQNAIILPLGILQPPFFDTEHSKAFNFGALGSLIGHEFSHTLDNLNRQELTANDQKFFQERRNCVKTIPAIPSLEDIVLNENIADFTGIRLSYFAMENKFVNDVRQEHNEELFFLNYAKMWCELSGDDTKEILVQDEHLPVASRVKTTLHNFERFINTYNCNIKEPGVNKCGFW